MHFDLFLPRENETELASQAAEFNIKPVFLYGFKTSRELKKKKNELSKQNINAKVGIYVKPKTFGDLKKAAKLWLVADFLAAINPGELVRAAVSDPRFDAVFRVPSVFGKDKPEYRRSNFNTVLANLASKNKVAYGIDFSYFLEKSGYALAKLLGREVQNIYLCRRKLPILIASLAREKWQIRWTENLAALGRILGLNAPQSRTAVSTAFEAILKRKERRRSKAFVRPGVELIE